MDVFTSGLRSLTLHSETPPTASGTILCVNDTSESNEYPIYVPASSLEAYKTATYWSEYASRYRPISTGEEGTGSVINYTSTDGNVVELYEASGFDAAVVSNTYSDGKGAIVFDGPLTVLGARAFYNCTTLATIEIPDGIRTIGGGAFNNCSNLAWPTIPSSVTKIEGSAFFGCDAFTRVVIPDSVTEYGSSVFQACPNLASISSRYSSADGRCLIINGVLNSFAYAGLGDSYTFPDSITSFGDSALRNCRYTGKLVIGDNVTRFEIEAFAYSQFSSIEIGNSLSYIGSSAFRCCSSFDLVLPASLTEVGKDVFTSGLHSLTLNSVTPPTAAGTILCVNDTSKSNEYPIYVPASSLEAYKTATYWSEYADRYQAISGTTPPSGGNEGTGEEEWN